MAWMYLLLAAAAFAVAFRSESIAIVVLCLLVACAAALAGALGLLTQRIGRRSRDDAALIDPVELQRLREQAEARRRAAATEAVVSGEARH